MTIIKSLARVAALSSVLLACAVTGSKAASYVAIAGGSRSDQEALRVITQELKSLEQKTSITRKLVERMQKRAIKVTVSCASGSCSPVGSGSYETLEECEASIRSDKGETCFTFAGEPRKH